MARKATLETKEIINLVENYFIDICERNPSMLKIPEIGAYIRSQGYNIQDYTIRRNTAVRDYIQQLKTDSSKVFYNKVSVYRDIDIDAFLSKNNTREKLSCAIRERESYYREIADAAAQSFKEAKKLKKTLDAVTKEWNTIKKEHQLLKQQYDEIRTNKRSIEKDNQKLKEIIDTYVYPEIANELLNKQGLLKNTANIIEPSSVTNSTVTIDTDISKIKNNLVKGLFDKV